MEMKKEEVRMKKKDSAKGKRKGSSRPQQSRPEHGADSQLHNYNVMLTRLGDLFGEDDEPAPPTTKK